MSLAQEELDIGQTAFLLPWSINLTLDGLSIFGKIPVRKVTISL